MRENLSSLRSCSAQLISLDIVPSRQGSNFSVKPSKHAYAATDNAVRTTTTLPLVRNLFVLIPSSPISEKNCLFPCRRRSSPVRRIPVPQRAKRAPMLQNSDVKIFRITQIDGQMWLVLISSIAGELRLIYQCKRELPQSSSNICAFKCSLCRTDLNQFALSEYH